MDLHCLFNAHLTFQIEPLVAKVTSLDGLLDFYINKKFLSFSLRKRLSRANVIEPTQHFVGPGFGLPEEAKPSGHMTSGV